jgi:circadian clock protein KaiB
LSTWPCGGGSAFRRRGSRAATLAEEKFADPGGVAPMATAARKLQEPEAVAAERRTHLRAEGTQGTVPHEVAYNLRLYVAGQLPNSVQALANLLEICRLHLAGRHTLEVVDHLENPRRALEDGVVATPALVKVAPSPSSMVVGTLSDRRTVLQALGIGEEP